MAFNLFLQGLAEILRNALVLVAEGPANGIHLSVYVPCGLPAADAGLPRGFHPGRHSAGLRRWWHSGGQFDAGFLSALPGRIFGTISNDTLIAVPLFILMGIILEKSRVAEELLGSMAKLFGAMRGGLGISVVVVGMLLAASTGIVGATVVTMGLLSLPSYAAAPATVPPWPQAPSAPPAPWVRSSRLLSPWCCWATFSPTPTSAPS